MSGYAAAALDALGDPNRRLILERLAERPQAVGVLAATLPISRPAVSQHLRVLKQAGLVRESVEGTRHVYRVDPAGFATVQDYLGRFWSTTMDNFARLAAAEAERSGEPGERA
ncbi:ArsR/SmtB family transcription factor [Prauserella oleivorans]|uniref:ArsR/SmtB family transcription factor n=1 Tax=Prauserella oleivorans TaxID=1478153 RepID=A0ABW5WI09_9PSEU